MAALGTDAYCRNSHEEQVGARDNPKARLFRAAFPMIRLAKCKLDYPGPQPAPRASMIGGLVRSSVAPELGSWEDTPIHTVFTHTHFLSPA